MRRRTPVGWTYAGHVLITSNSGEARLCSYCTMFLFIFGQLKWSNESQSKENNQIPQLLSSLHSGSTVKTKDSIRPGSHGDKNFASALQRPRPLHLKIWQRGHTHIFIEAPSARCSKFGKLSMACFLLSCLSLFSFVSHFFSHYMYCLSLTRTVLSLSLSPNYIMFC